MYCHNCGKQIPDGVKFCRYCGASQANVNGMGAAPQPNPQPRPQPQPQPRPQPQPQPQPQPSPQPQPQPRPQPQPQPQPQPSPQPSGGGVMLESQHCSYKVAPEQEMGKFEWGGIPEGTVDIYKDRLEFFKKSKMVSLAFGAIGSALSGKGKPDIVIYARDVRKESASHKNNTFRFYLNDGRMAFIAFTGMSARQQACANAMWKFLDA